MTELQRLQKLHNELTDKYDHERRLEREAAIRHAVRIETLGEARHLVAAQIHEVEKAMGPK